MSTTSTIMMIIAILTLWGGLGAAAVNLFRRPDLSALDEDIPQEV
jgi:hypothetical protein